MSLATLIPHKPVRLLELFNSAPQRVDAARGVIKGVKIVGIQSRNTARVLGLDPREFGDALDQTYSYSRDGLRRAIPKYTGASVRFDHPPTQMRGGTRIVTSHVRPALSVSGQLKNVRMVETGNDETDGLYGDFVLIKSHPHSAFILEVAEKMPGALCLSHNASGRPVLQGGRVVIEEILAVRSVDIIGGGDGGTTATLYESKSDVESPVPNEEIEEMATTIAPETMDDLRMALEEILGDGSMSAESKLTAIADLLSESPPEAAGTAAMESAMTLIESCGREISAIRIKAVAALRTDASRKALVESWPRRGVRPARSAAALIESADHYQQADSVEDFVRSLRKGRVTSSPDFLMGRR